VDEIDTFLDAGYTEFIDKYMDISLKSNANPRMVFLSATYTTRIRSLMESKFGPKEDLFKVLIDKNTHMNLSNLEHEFLHINSLDKHKPLLDMLKEHQGYIKKANGSTMVFCNSVGSCQALDYYLKENGFNAITLHGDMPSQLRIQSYNRFKNRDVNIMLSTDLGSRGLDFPFVNHVINLDFPKAASDYLHRAGRAGRAGRKGKVSSFYHNRDYNIVKELKFSYENNVPLKIAGSAYAKINKEDFKKKEGDTPQDQAKPKKTPDLKTNKYLPTEYMDFKNQWEKSKEEGKNSRVKGYKKGKDEMRTKLMQAKKKMKMKKGLRTTNSKYIGKLKQSIRRIRKSSASRKKV